MSGLLGILGLQAGEDVKGLILDLVRTGRHEAKKLAYLTFCPPHAEASNTNAESAGSD